MITFLRNDRASGMSIDMVKKTLIYLCIWQKNTLSQT
jgi:hypothetical protein